MVTAPGYRTLVTHAFVRGDELLDKDSVFGVKDSLIYDWSHHSAAEPTPDGRDLQGKQWARACFDIVLAPGRQSTTPPSWNSTTGRCNVIRPRGPNPMRSRGSTSTDHRPRRRPTPATGIATQTVFSSASYGLPHQFQLFRSGRPPQRRQLVRHDQLLSRLIT
jgi:hypothetical protein